MAEELLLKAGTVGFLTPSSSYPLLQARCWVYEYGRIGFLCLLVLALFVVQGRRRGLFVVVLMVLSHRARYLSAPMMMWSKPTTRLRLLGVSRLAIIIEVLTPSRDNDNRHVYLSNDDDDEGGGCTR